jgi:ribosomal protein L40E
MIECPNCKASLPDWAKSCQFCQTDTTQVLRPKQQTPSSSTFTTPAWIWAAYYAVSALITIDAIIGIVTTITANQKDGIEFFGVIVLVFDGISLLVGIGLLLRITIIRAIVNFLCYVRIAFGLLGLIGGLFGTLAFGAAGILFIVMDIVNICIYGFMIYLIGETDKAVY